MSRIAVPVIALSVAAIALLLGWDRYSEWRIRHSDGYKLDRSICETGDSIALSTGGLPADMREARRCWEDLERKYGISR